jgi:hypothetical protein
VTIDGYEAFTYFLASKGNLLECIRPMRQPWRI